jgi:hypothetical protein
MGDENIYLFPIFLDIERLTPMGRSPCPAITPVNLPSTGPLQKINQDAAPQSARGQRESRALIKSIGTSERCIISAMLRWSVATCWRLMAFLSGFLSLTVAPQMVAAANAPHVETAISAARENGVDARVFLAVGWYESRLNPSAGLPTRKGQPMSSAVGMWQILAARDTLKELGIAKQDRTNYERTTPAVAQYFSRQQDRLRYMGFDPTPGRTYMTWNVGPGMTAAILKAKSDERIDSIAHRTLAKHGPKFIRKWLRNNPSLYRSGMTAGQVAANYELKMAQSMKAVDHYLSGMASSIAPG